MPPPGACRGFPNRRGTFFSKFILAAVDYTCLNHPKIHHSPRPLKSRLWSTWKIYNQGPKTKGCGAWRPIEEGLIYRDALYPSSNCQPDDTWAHEGSGRPPRWIPAWPSNRHSRGKPFPWKRLWVSKNTNILEIVQVMDMISQHVQKIYINFARIIAFK